MKKPPQTCSDAFEEAFADGVGGCRHTCECGRECFDDANSYDWQEGEIEELRKNAIAHPDKYVNLPYSCSLLTVSGRTFVLGCPCNGARPYEDWIRRHAEKLAAFLVKIRQERLDYAEALKVADTLANFPMESKPEPAFPTQSFA